jgi:hypothetical protein
MKGIKLLLIEFCLCCCLLCLAIKPAKADGCDADCYNGNNCSANYTNATNDAMSHCCDYSASDQAAGDACAAACGCYGMTSGPPPCMD